MQDVATRAGVSAKTVSRVFNDDPHVTDDTRERVQSAMRELKYVPNMLARTFREGKSAVIGIAVPDVADPFFAAVAKGIEFAAREHDMAIVVTSLGDDPSLEQSIIETTIRHQIGGLIIAPISGDQAYLARWQDSFPIVCIDRAPAKLNVDYFVEDDFGGAFEATHHLIQHGHRRIAIVGDSVEVPTTRLRLEGYTAALNSAGLGTSEELIALGSRDADAAAQVCKTILELRDPPTAIFSSNARFSIGVFPALQALDRTDIALISFGDFPMADVLQPSVSVIDQDPRHIGRVAAERILARIATPNKRFRRKNVLPVKLIERQSCQSVPVLRSVVGLQ
ncbi:LacI family DNA-binding transcriptional regulator [Arthrobacter sp. PAMC 25486]|uniref:LacI family DNA-binding transcriptional regulator n=1 Tax=Arthrobacter sp. PAMC 25486 TaxID=1494608 RepID=UPI0020A6BB34|nr:LacI family DNA-binding transcriptional regulator [Arthrobacter sp. PAMC 25486]